MDDLRNRIRLAESATHAARIRFRAWRGNLRGAVRRTAAGPVALGSGVALGFALGRYRGPKHLEPPLAARLQRLAHLSGMLGSWSLGFDVVNALLRSR